MDDDMSVKSFNSVASFNSFLEEDLEDPKAFLDQFWDDDDTQVQYRSKFHHFVRRAFNPWFNWFIMLCILFDIVLTALQTDRQIDINLSHFFSSANNVLLVLYTIEFILKIYAEGFKGYFRSKFNIFDLIILAMSYLQLAISSIVDVSFLRAMRAIRAMRALRTVSFFKPLQIVVSSLVQTIISIINLVALLFLTLYVFGIFGFYLFGLADSQHWGTMGECLLTLHTWVTADGWTEIQGYLDRVDLNSRFFAIIFIIIGHFIFTNLFIGVVIQNLQHCQEQAEAEERVKKTKVVDKKKKKMLQQQQTELSKILQKQKVDSQQDIQRYLSALVGKLRHDDTVPMLHLTCNLTWLQTFMMSLDHQENTMYRLQQLHFELAECLAEIQERRLQSRVYG
eukprot:gnl/Trimastix_PCT/3004.p1 GENE.gnl/Trimastix_PCT/3004~~gnl/Trimastix_PCT/3004.p1  ORF type:complete len:427 (+),score=162.09 gnl/Trimastix_PCT/3004:99-1283(+)